MTKRSAALLGAIVSLGLGLNHGAVAQSTQPEETKESMKVPKGVGSATIVTIHAKVVEVDKASKLVTLEGPKGRRMTVKANNPYNLAAAKVGEPVVIRFYEVVTVRKKQLGETLPKASVSQGIISTAQPGEVPGGVAAKQYNLVASVVAIDEANGTVTVKAFDGTTETVKVKDPNNLKQLKVGDELVVGLEEAVAVSLEQASGSSTLP